MHDGTHLKIQSFLIMKKTSDYCKYHSYSPYRERQALTASGDTVAILFIKQKPYFLKLKILSPTSLQEL